MYPHCEANFVEIWDLEMHIWLEMNSFIPPPPSHPKFASESWHTCFKLSSKMDNCEQMQKFFLNQVEHKFTRVQQFLNTFLDIKMQRMFLPCNSMFYHCYTL